MSERHVSGTKLVQPTQCFQRVLDRMAAFDSDQRSDLARRLNPLDVVHGSREIECFGEAVHHGVNQLDLFERP